MLSFKYPLVQQRVPCPAAQVCTMPRIYLFIASFEWSFCSGPLGTKEKDMLTHRGSGTAGLFLCREREDNAKETSKQGSGIFPFPLLISLTSLIPFSSVILSSQSSYIFLRWYSLCWVFLIISLITEP